MDKNKLQNVTQNVTQSRKGNKFQYTSPIPGLHIYDNVWETSLDFFKKLETQEFWDAQNGVSGKIQWVREDYLDEEVGKRASTCWIWNSEEVKDALEEVIDSYLWHWDLDPHSRESLRITKYSPNGEFFSMHADYTFATPRTTSLVYYPNDDYEGGELEFLHFGIKIKPKAGQLFLFPAAYSYEHKIYPVTGGNKRYTLVTFFNFMTEKERSNRNSMLDPNKYYQSDLKYVFDDNFGEI